MCVCMFMCAHTRMYISLCLCVHVCRNHETRRGAMKGKKEGLGEGSEEEKIEEKRREQ